MEVLSGELLQEQPRHQDASIEDSKLAKSSLEGSASSGGSDAAVLTIGSRAFATSNADTVLHLSSSWTTAKSASLATVVDQRLSSALAPRSK